MPTHSVQTTSFTHRKALFVILIPFVCVNLLAQQRNSKKIRTALTSFTLWPMTWGMVI